MRVSIIGSGRQDSKAQGPKKPKAFRVETWGFRGLGVRV